MAKYKYTQHAPGHIKIGDKDIILQNGEEYDLPEDNKDVKRLWKMKYLELKVTIVAKTTKPNDTVNNTANTTNS